jgi:hypothetical protein
MKASIMFIPWFAGAAIGSEVHRFIKKIYGVTLQTL